MRDLQWIDKLKGLGIVALIYGHVYADDLTDFIFLWRMPLFFLLSGYLFRPFADRKQYLADKAVSLLVPYLSFLVIISFPALVAHLFAGEIQTFVKLVGRMISGGRKLQGYTAVFWFITCLFITQQLANLVLAKLKNPALWALMTALAIMGYLTGQITRPMFIPWSADTVLFALPLFFIGWKARNWNFDRHQVLMLILAAIACAAVFQGLLKPFNMKYNGYGTPIASLVLALCCIHFMVVLVKRIPSSSKVGMALESIGQGSIFLVFTHMIFNETMKDIPALSSPHLRMVVSTMLPWGGYLLVKRSELGRALLLGSKRDFHSIRERFTPAKPANI